MRLSRYRSRRGDDARSFRAQLPSQRPRTDDLRIVTQVEQDPERHVFALQVERDELAAAEALAERLESLAEPRAEMLEQATAATRRDAQLHGVVVGRVALESLAPPFPELLQVEAGVAREAFRRRGHGLQSRQPEHTHFALYATDEIPGVDLDDERVRLDVIVTQLAVAATIRDVDTLILPDRAAKIVHEGRGVEGTKPRLGVKQEPAARVLRAQLMHRRHRGRELVERAAGRQAELAYAAERGGAADQCERFRFAR